MPRAHRVFVENGVYHVYNRLARGERVFAEPEMAGEFVRLLEDVVTRDRLTVFAWCLMPNHYHLAVRTSAVSLDRPMRSLQQRMTRLANARSGVFGPLWQGRYKAKLVAEQRYLDQLLVYIHLNPVTAGLVEDPADHRWSGHAELLGKVRGPICETDEVLRLFGTTRRRARAAYVRQLKAERDATWVGEDPGHLPWWRLGRPPAGEDEDPELAIRRKRAEADEGPAWRPRLDAARFISLAAEHLGVDLAALRSTARASDIVRAREILIVVGVERYRIGVKALAHELAKSPNGLSQTLARGIQNRVNNPELSSVVDRLDRWIAAES